MGEYKLGGLSFNATDVTVMKKQGELKGDIKYKFETPLEELSLTGKFETNPIVLKKKEATATPKVIETKKKKKKGNELF